MPGENPYHSLAGKSRSGSENAHGDCFRQGAERQWFTAPSSNSMAGKRLIRSAKAAGTVIGLASMLVAGIDRPAFAQQTILSGLLDNLARLDHTTILPFAVFGGALSFAILSAFWLIRERVRIGEKNAELRQSFARVRAERDRYAALLEMDGLCVVVWNGEDDAPQVVGSLNPASGVPDNNSGIMAFGNWLQPDSAMKLETATNELRKDGNHFILEVMTRAGATLEAQGKVSGGQAFVRFLLLDGARESLAAAKRETARLTSRFEIIEKLFDAIPAPVWINGSDGKLAYVNPAYSDAVEAPNPDEAVNDNRQLFDAKERALIGSALEKEAYFHGELPAVTAGDRRSMDTTTVSSNHGSAGMAVDRSDLEAVRATLKHVIASHEQTFDHLGTAIAIFDSKQKLQFHNSSFQQLWELSSADLEGNPSNGDLLETLRSQSRLLEMPDWKKWKAQQLETYHATETREENWHLPDGRTLRVVVNPQNQGGTSWVFENLTEELALKSNYNSLIRVQGETLDHLNEAVAVFGSDGKVRLTNPAFLDLWGFKDQQSVEGHHIKLVSQSIGDGLIDRQAWETICLGITGLDDDRKDLSGRLELVDGTFLDYHLVHLPEGQSMLTFADVSASVNIERALKDRNDALEESDALKSRFIQHVSYELRAPLTSIAGFAEIMTSGATGELNAKQDEYLQYITQSSDVLKALIDDILDLASIDAGAMELENEKVSFSEIVADCIEAVADKTGRFQISIVPTIAKNADQIIGDRARLRQIIYNLLSNAVAASPDGGKVSVDITRSGPLVDIAISDEGPGVSEENRDTIFERFESGAAGERRRGAGLGLSIVKSFAELHGGAVRLEDSDGKGAKFVCSLPIEPGSQLQAAE